MSTKINYQNSHWISIHNVVFFMCFCMACPLWGQAYKKKDLKLEDYSGWYNISPAVPNDNGTWVSFHKYYDTGSDTLVLQHNRGADRFHFPNTYREQFIVSYNTFVFLNTNGLTVLNLKNLSQKTITNVVDYKLSANGKYLASVQEKKDNGQGINRTLLISEVAQSPLKSIENIEDYVFDDSSKQLAFSQKTSAGYQVGVLKLDLPNPAITILKNGFDPFRKIVWGPNNSLAFFEELAENQGANVHWLFNTEDPQKRSVFISENQTEFTYPIKVINNISTTLHFSPDGEKLFFHVQKQTKEEAESDNNSKVQIWNTKDLLIYPSYAGNKSFITNPPIMIAWDKKDNALKVMGTKDSSKSVWGTDGKFVFTYSLLDDVPGNDEPWEETPIFVYNTQTGKEKFVISRTEYMPINVSPSGRYLSYFDNTNWWIYDAEMDVHKNITRNIPSNFRNNNNDYSGVKPPHGLAGWTSSDVEILLYDEFDIWSIRPDGNEFRKLTDGRNDGNVYKVYKPKASISAADNFLGYCADIFDLNRGILIKGSNPNTGKTGLFYKKCDLEIQTLVYEDAYISNAVKTLDDNTIFYTKERYNLPPEIHTLSFETKSDCTVYKSNPQHAEFNWGKSELIAYDNPIDSLKKLHGALFYPSNFNPTQKYPMIVYIYQKMSDRLHKFINPSLYNGADINISNLTNQGYFVFCPDIAYKINEPGISALQCVTTGVEEVLKMGFVNRKRLGLFGHSFGGFETSFIVTQSDLFAAAISGAGYHNILSFYLSVAWIWQKPQAGRFLHDQQRYDKTYFEIPDMYLKNSTVNFAENLKTPLLTYTGDKDENINWQQSVELYNALRVLKKDHIMLIYPNEGHDFFSAEAQIDITHKRWDWFDHYLKGKPAMPWMKEFK